MGTSPEKERIHIQKRMTEDKEGGRERLERGEIKERKMRREIRNEKARGNIYATYKGEF